MSRWVQRVVWVLFATAWAGSCFAGPPGEVRVVQVERIAERRRMLQELSKPLMPLIFKEDVTALARKYAIDDYIESESDQALWIVEHYPAGVTQLAACRFLVKEPGMASHEAVVKAAEVLARDHARDPDMGAFCDEITTAFRDPGVDVLHQAVMTTHPDRAQRALACRSLACALHNRAWSIRTWLDRPKKPPPTPPRLIGRLTDRLLERSIVRYGVLDPLALERRAVGLLERLVAEFGDVPFKKTTMAASVADHLFLWRDLGVGRPAPEVAGVDVEGRPFKLSDYRGRVVVLAFGDTPTPNRGEEYPERRALVERFKDKPFTLLGVNTDTDPAKLRASVAAGDVTWRCWVDGGPNGPIARAWHLRYPYKFVIDREGIIRASSYVSMDFGAVVERLLAGGRPEA